MHFMGKLNEVFAMCSNALLIWKTYQAYIQGEQLLQILHLRAWYVVEV